MSLPPPTLFSIIIPARDEEGSVGEAVMQIHGKLGMRGIAHEIIVVNDGSKDGTWAVLQELQLIIPELRPVDSGPLHGFGRAVIHGLNEMKGDAVAIMMADLSDSPDDLLTYWDLLCAGHECVFGSRFISGGGVVDYPPVKRVLNRLANLFIRMLFNIPLNDTTNAFKAYRREVIEGCRPLISPHFNLTVELPLKAIVRGYDWTVTPVQWRNRRTGEAKLRIREMGSRYLFIILYLWLEKYFSRGDYRKQTENKR
ncbi:MAG: cell wall biosynthesis glycosyltransferase [Verrucomicrobiaceae bacterium]|nr:cell wall biosynthesis glycosyltransferase [Verrucomicrobiaceae bacterium]